ncbi:MAG: tetratricopeptide repeat protein [Gemmatimonadota bacterium]|jgi:hypothetical protein
MLNRASLAVLAALLAPGAPLRAQEILARALDLERQGRFQEAVVAFRTVLAREPASPAALLGAERAYMVLGQRDSIVAMVRRALALDSANATAHTIELRTARAMGGDALAAEALARWMAAAPRSEAPYREWVRAMLAVGRVDEARQAVGLARERLGDPERLRPEMAQVEAAAGNWVLAAAEWRSAVERQSGLLGAATFSLQAAPPGTRDRLLRTLTEADSTNAARRVAAELLLGWNEPVRAWAMLRGALPGAQEQRSAALRSFADRASAQEGREAQRVAAEALETLAATAGPQDAAGLRVESARAYAAAGDGASARRILRAMADDPAAPGGAAGTATATLVELYLREGNPSEASRLLQQARNRLPGGEAERLWRLVARSWIRTGDLDRAEASVAADSSLAGDEVRGWIALYRGDLGRARALLRTGVRPSERESAAERAAMAALLQVVEIDWLPALGAALLMAERGDTLGASRALVALARSGLTGEAEVLLLAARYAELARDPSAARAIWEDLAERHAESSAAPAALLGLARAAAARGDVPGAVARLETLILNYPESALAPEARRELNRARGLVPRS